MFIIGTGSVRARGAAQVAIERQVEALGRGAGDGHAGAQDGVGAQLGLVRGAVQRQHRLVDGDLVERVHAEQLFGDLVVDVLDGLQHALAAVAALVAVAQLKRLVHAGGCAGRHRRPPHHIVFQPDLHLNGGVAAESRISRPMTSVIMVDMVTFLQSECR